MSLDYDAAKAQRAKPLMAPFFTPNLAIALTPRIATLYRAFGQPDSKIFIRPNPVMMQPNDSVDATPHLPTPYKHLMLGRICPRKNQLRGLELLSKLPPDHGLIIAGPLVEKEDAAYLEKLKSEIARLDLTPRVALHPHAIKNPYALYEKITSLWCLSTHEGLPNVVLEALWMGKPCFVNRDLGLKNYVINNKNGADINLNDLTNAATITKTLSMIDESAIQKDARAAFDPGKINDKTYLLFKKL